MRFAVIFVVMVLIPLAEKSETWQPLRLPAPRTIDLLEILHPMKISDHFDLREFVPRSTFEKWGDRSTWFIDKKLIAIAEFYKKFFFEYYSKKYAGKVVKSVSININNWHLSGSQQYRGYRPADYDGGGKESQHRYGRGFDCDIVINFTEGQSIEADYKEVHQVIKSNETLFLSVGVTAVESVEFAPTWLHTDTRWTGLKEIKIVEPSTKI